jgi:signal recognition particle receptor subunit beta
MVGFNHATKHVSVKLVYYGPGLSGKTTNLQWIHDHVTFKEKGKLLSLATESERTLLFDFLPVELGTIRGYYTRVQLYTVPGQVFYDATRRMVLKDADAVVFVADSQEALLEANIESLQNLKDNLAANGLAADLPLVLQYNKRDLPNIAPVEEMRRALNPRGVPDFEACAASGDGVFETLKAVAKQVLTELKKSAGA